MLRIGIIGYGRRIAGMAKGLDIYDIPYRVTAIADPGSERIQAANDPFLSDTRFYDSADELLAGADELDGIMIGTRCNLHTDLAIKVAPTQLPLFLEKPVSITFDQVRRLHAAFKDYSAPTVVSFPLRLSPVAQKVRELIESDKVGSIEQVVAFNDVGYGSVYFRSWYRNYDLDGGLWLQKFTHDVDYINYLLDARPRWVSAMNSRRVYGGDKPFDLQCKDCAEQETCPESPFVRFRTGFEGGRVRFAEEQVYRDDQYCVFPKDISFRTMAPACWNMRLASRPATRRTSLPAIAGPAAAPASMVIAASSSLTGTKTISRSTVTHRRWWRRSTSAGTCPTSAVTAN